MRLVLSLLVSLARGGGLAGGQNVPHLPTVVRREAEADFSSALARNPRDAATRAAYARWLLVDPSRRQDAEMEQRAAVATAPADGDLRAEFAELLAPRSEAEAEEQYLQGLERCPRSARLRASYARFLVVYKQEPDKALLQYAAGSELADPAADPPAFAEMLAQYGTLVTRSQGRGRSALAVAEKQFVRAVADSPSAQSQHRYATFLRFDKKDYRSAEAAYEQALALDDEFPAALCGYATLLDTVRGLHDEAEGLYERARPTGECLAAYATFLRRVRQDFVRMADLVVSDHGQQDTSLQAGEWDNARLWHRANAAGGLGHGIAECARVGADAVRILACVLLYLAQFLGAAWR